MSVSWLTIRDLEYLLALAQFQHFGKAAESCNVSQPALSAQIKKIEEVLDTQVFERTQRRVSITTIGEAIVKQAKLVLEEAEKIESLAKVSTEPLNGSFRLGAIASLGPYMLPYVLGPIRKLHPKLDLRLKEGLTDGLLEDLDRGTLDGVLAARTFTEKGYVIHPLFHEPFSVLLPASHPLAQKKFLRPQDLNAKDMVLLEDGHCLRDQAIDLCPVNRRGNLHDFHATSLETLRYLVANEAGYTLFPSLAIRDENSMKGLVQYRSLEGRSVGRDIILVGRERSSRHRDLDALALSLRKIMKSVPGKNLQIL